MFCNARIDLCINKVLNFLPGGSTDQHHSIVNIFWRQGQSRNQVCRENSLDLLADLAPCSIRAFCSYQKMADELDFRNARDANQSFRERKSLGLVHASDGFGTDVKCSLGRKPANFGIAPVYFTGDFNVLRHLLFLSSLII